MSANHSDGAEAITTKVDLSTYDGVEELYASIVDTGRPVDAIALNEGVGISGAFVDTDVMDDLRLISLNVGSVVHLAKRVISDMAARACRC